VNHRVPGIWTIRVTATTGNFAALVCKKRNPLGPGDFILPQVGFSRFS
jgi:hypothetical protein